MLPRSLTMVVLPSSYGAMSQVHLPCFVAKPRIIRTFQGHAQHSTATLPRDVQAFSQVSQAFSQVKVRL